MLSGKKREDSRTATALHSSRRNLSTFLECRVDTLSSENTERVDLRRQPVTAAPHGHCVLWSLKGYFTFKWFFFSSCFFFFFVIFNASWAAKMHRRQFSHRLLYCFDISILKIKGSPPCPFTPIQLKNSNKLGSRLKPVCPFDLNVFNETPLEGKTK